MRKHLIWTIPPIAVIAGFVSLPIASAQTAAAPKPVDEVKPVDDIQIDKWNSVPLPGSAYAGLKSAPAPRRDLSGVWDATGDATGGAPPGIQASGANERRSVLPGNNVPPGGEPDESHIANPLSYTALGEKTLEAHKPTGVSVRAVPDTLGNDPVDICDPPGFPRLDLAEFRAIEITQTADQLIILNQYYRTWRTIWTDGRELPKSPEPRWNGYSVGKWVDDYTFVVRTVGMNEKTWLDKAGRPHSSELEVEERFHRVDHDHMELTVSIDDPKMYTAPWVALNKFPLRLQPRGFDIRELYCAPSDLDQYNKEVGDSLDAGPDK
jgi:hypothetical protein